MTFYTNSKNKLDDIKFLTRIQQVAKRMNIDLYVFTPEDVDDVSRKVYCHFIDFKQKKWKRMWRDFPDIIFDRCRYQPNKRFELLRKFRAKYPQLLYLNRPLSNKWIMYELFQRHPQLRPYLPETKLYNKLSDVTSLLSRYSSVYVKPVNGTGGRGILKIKKYDSNNYMLEGRSMNRNIIRPSKYSKLRLTNKLNQWNTGKKLLVQQGLDITLANGRVHDYRLLIQKNGQGNWQITGIAGRIGAKSSITSNLHGGGRAIAAEKLLKQRVRTQAKMNQITKKMEWLAFETVHVVENNYGSICELALDIAMDRKGRLWLLEINPKPAREVFLRIGKKDVYLASIKRPLEYALWMWKHQA